VLPRDPSFLPTVGGGKWYRSTVFAGIAEDSGEWYPACLGAKVWVASRQWRVVPRRERCDFDAPGSTETRLVPTGASSVSPVDCPAQPVANTTASCRASASSGIATGGSRGRARVRRAAVPSPTPPIAAPATAGQAASSALAQLDRTGGSSRSSFLMARTSRDPGPYPSLAASAARAK
jgi:hypothetical protein